MADVKSYRISDDAHERVKEIAKDFPSMDDTFKVLLGAYEESKLLSSTKNAAYLSSMKSLCDGVYNQFRVLLESQNAEIEQVKEQNSIKLDKLRQELEDKTLESEQALLKAKQALETAETARREANTLKELNDALKGENEALTANLKLLQEKVKEAAKKPIRKTAASPKAVDSDKK